MTLARPNERAPTRPYLTQRTRDLAGYKHLRGSNVTPYLRPCQKFTTKVEYGNKTRTADAQQPGLGSKELILLTFVDYLHEAQPNPASDFDRMLFLEALRLSSIVTLAALAPLLVSSLPQAASSESALIPGPHNLNASLVPAACTATCQPALAAQSTCGTTLKCLCTNANGASFAQCLDCVVGTQPDTLAQNAANGVLSDYTTRCAQDGEPIAALSLSLAPGPTASGTIATTNAAPATPRLIRTAPLVMVAAALALVSWTL
ncbi:hypothetical protein C8R46DRAFT_1357641 [Mycena filopes]|nr:hypothetical protein C8R46DRAFT_1357641 [Mycena filopes]